MNNCDRLAPLTQGGLRLESINRRALIKWLVMALAAAGCGSVLAADEAPLPKPPASTIPLRKAVYIDPSSRRHGKFSQIAFKMTSEDTDGLLGSTELVLEPGTIGAVPHLHRGFDEICRVVEGALDIMVDDQVTTVPAGGWHLRPRGRIHAFWNSGTVPAKCVENLCPRRP